MLICMDTELQRDRIQFVVSGYRICANKLFILQLYPGLWNGRPCNKNMLQSPTSLHLRVDALSPNAAIRHLTYSTRIVLTDLIEPRSLTEPSLSINCETQSSWIGLEVSFSFLINCETGGKEFQSTLAQGFVTANRMPMGVSS